MLNRFSATFSAEVGRISDMIHFIDVWSENAAVSDDLRQSLRLIVDELVSNVCRHGYGSMPPDGTITLTLFQSDDTITLEIQDFGVPFNPLEHEEPDTSLPLEERPIGGLGILLVRRLSKEQLYRRDAGKNILTVVLDNRNSP